MNITNIKKIIVLIVLLFSSLLVAKEQTLYCSSDNSTGFVDTDKNGNYEQTEFVREKFELKIDFQNNTFTSADLTMEDATCINYLPFIQCIDFGYGININKENLNFILYKGFGHLSGQNDTISISYGSCELSK